MKLHSFLILLLTLWSESLTSLRFSTKSRQKLPFLRAKTDIKLDSSLIYESSLSQRPKSLRTLIIDNYDSYTFNIWQYLAEINQRAPKVIYNNDWEYLKWLEETNYSDFDSIILSPGPGCVTNPDDFGICRDVILRTPLPLLGVCLGHQGLAHAFGGRVGKAPEPVHGRIWTVEHSGTGLFQGLAPRTPVTRYHSLAVSDETTHPLPSCLEVTAKTAEGVIMALQHKTRPLYGVQFHPESVGTEHGKRILSNFMDIASKQTKKKFQFNQKLDFPVPESRASYIKNSPSFASRSSGLGVNEEKNSSGMNDKIKSTRNVFITSRKFSSLSPSTVGQHSSNEDDLIERLFQQLFSHSNASFWLDNPSYRQSNQARNPNCPVYSFLGCADSDGGSVLEYEGGERLLQRHSDGGTAELNQSIFEFIHHSIEEQKNDWNVVAHAVDPSPIIPSEDLQAAMLEVAKGRVLFGFLGYEARHEAAALLTRTSLTDHDTTHSPSNSHAQSHGADALHSEIKGPAPKSVFFAPSRYLAVDHTRQILHVISIQDDARDYSSTETPEAHTAFVKKVDEVMTTYSEKSNSWSHNAGSKSTEFIDTAERGTLYSSMSKKQYASKISKCLAHISDGQSYELCLTMKFRGKRSALLTSSSSHDDFAVYKRLRRRNPAPYSSFIRYKSSNTKMIGASHYDFSVCCSSPERYLKLTKEGVIESKPIKGTAKRDLQDLERDHLIADALAQDEKCRAENLMIVDLVRNDLGRVCEIGSVHTPKLMAVETFTSVHQMVSTIRGQLCTNMNVADALAATFPGGSMTGAPKLRTMELIDELEERQPRGIYSGTIGYIALDGSADLNIVIRTAVLSGDEITVGAGGAIVAQSDPEMEVEEVLTKARSVSSAIGFDLAFSPDP